MGEYADDAFFAGLDEEWDEEWEGGSSRRFLGDRRQRKTCRGCGLHPLFWARSDGRWRLHEKTDAGEVPHRCPDGFPNTEDL